MQNKCPARFSLNPCHSTLSITGLTKIKNPDGLWGNGKTFCGAVSWTTLLLPFFLFLGGGTGWHGGRPTTGAGGGLGRGCFGEVCDGGKDIVLVVWDVVCCKAVAVSTVLILFGFVFLARGSGILSFTYVARSPLSELCSNPWVVMNHFCFALLNLMAKLRISCKNLKLYIRVFRYYDDKILLKLIVY